MSIESEDVERHALAALHAAGGRRDKVPAPPPKRYGRRRVGFHRRRASPKRGSSPIAPSAWGSQDPRTPKRSNGSSNCIVMRASRGISSTFTRTRDPPAIRDWLHDAGLEKARGWMKFTRGRDAPPAAETDLSVRSVEFADDAAFGRIVSDAFDLGAQAAEWLACLVNAEGWRIYMSFDGDEPAGTGGLFVRNGVGYCDWGATAPAFRRRGSQSALLRATHSSTPSIWDAGSSSPKPARKSKATRNTPTRTSCAWASRRTSFRENYAPPR